MFIEINIIKVFRAESTNEAKENYADVGISIKI